MLSTSPLEVRLQAAVDGLAQTQKLHETVVDQISKNDNNLPTESQTEQIAAYRELEIQLEAEAAQLTEDLERRNRAVETSKRVRRVMAGTVEGVDSDGDGIAYRSMSAYARDTILARDTPVSARIAANVDDAEIQQARERLQLAKRTPDNTLSSDVPGLQPPQHITEILQVIDTSRPIVTNSPRDTLMRGKITYPRIDTRPAVDVQNTEKSEAGNRGMEISMQEANATVYLGGGDLSWQAVNWSTPSALDAWFRLAAADYALKTETDAAQTLESSAFAAIITDELAGTYTFTDFLAAVGEGGSAVYDASGRTANTVYMAIDQYWYLFGLTSDSFAQFATISADRVGPLQFIPSRGLHAGVIIVGDREGMLVAETPGAPVDLQVTEPAIGGYEVGIIGAFEAVVVDEGAFSLITAAS